MTVEPIVAKTRCGATTPPSPTREPSAERNRLDDGDSIDWLRGEIDMLLATNGVAIPEDPMLAITTQPMDWHARRMFSSCAWFFDHLDGVEPKICVAHAFRACELAGPDASRLREGLRIRLPSDD